MFLTAPTERIVPGFGSKSAPICIVGEAPGAEEDRVLRPFVGQSGTVLDQCLHGAMITRSECYLTNVVKTRPRGNDIEPYYNTRTGTFTDAGRLWLDRLEEELQGVTSNTIVALGATALSALTGRKSVSKYRGYVMETLPRYGRRKVIGAYHPSASLRGQYILRYYITADFRKAKLESAYPEIRRPERNIIIPEGISETLQWLDAVNKKPYLSIDIEVMNFQVSAISYAWDAHNVVAIPYAAGIWTEDDELILWRKTNDVLSNPAVSKLFQNGIFDVCFLWTECGIKVQGHIDDSMIAHHVMYPDMLKGLGFLGSMYCGAQEYWKDAVKFDNIKEES